MAEQERRTAKRPAPKDEAEAGAKGSVADKGKKLKKTMDDVLNEIDTVLEENAEEFVKSYVQRGGE